MSSTLPQLSATRRKPRALYLARVAAGFVGGGYLQHEKLLPNRCKPRPLEQTRAPQKYAGFFHFSASATRSSERYASCFRLAVLTNHFFPQGA